MIGPLGRLGAAATLGQHCPQMTRRRCTKLRVAFSFCHVVSDPTLEVWRRRVGGAFVNFILLGEYYFIQYNVNLTKQTHTHHDALDARA